MANTGYKSPTSTGDNYNEWTSPSNVFSEDGNCASAGDEGYSQDYYDFDFSFASSPENVTSIDGINIKGYSCNTAGIEASLAIRFSWDSGSNYTSVRYMDVVDGDYCSDCVGRWMGSDVDEWGRNWTPAEFNNTNFRLKIHFGLGGYTSTCYVDLLQVNIYYSTDGVATIDTQAVDSVTKNGASFHGDLTDDGYDWGSSHITERGFVYDTSSYGDPGNTGPASSSYSDVLNETGTYGVATYDISYDKLYGGTTYYVRGYAKNEAGNYGYGDEVSFTTDALEEKYKPTIISDI